MKKAVFLDRDGTLIYDKNYLDTPEGVEWYEGTFDALASLQDVGYVLIIITNQSGVARGKMDEEDVQAIHDRMREDLRRNGISVEDFYYCPYLEDAKVPEYCRDSSLRKPSPGMLLEAGQDHDLDLSRSYTIGDKPSDVEAGSRAGTRTLLVGTGKDITPSEFPEDYSAPDYFVDDIVEAARTIRQASRSESTT